MNDVTHNRRSKRSLVLLTARIRTSGDVIEARLRNLSQNGALLEAETLPGVGDEVVFERGDTIVAGRVAWCAKGRFGIEFHKPIEESEVLVHVGRPKAKAAGQPAFRRGGIRETGLTLREQRFAEAWIRPSGRTTGS